MDKRNTDGTTLIYPVTEYKVQRFRERHICVGWQLDREPIRKRLDADYGRLGTLTDESKWSAIQFSNATQSTAGNEPMSGRKCDAPLM